MHICVEDERFLFVFYIWCFLQDIIKRIMSFTANGSRGISVLSVNGAVANVTILPHGSSRRVMTFKVYIYMINLVLQCNLIT